MICARWRLVSIAPLLLLGACVQYRPQAYNSREHLAAWKQRDSTSQEVQAFAARLARDSPLGPQPFDSKDGLTLPEAQLVALAFNPELRHRRAQSATVLAAAENAGLLPDPQLSLEFQHVIDAIEKPWVLAGALGFTLPVSGRLKREKRLAQAELDAELWRVAEQEWTTLNTLARTWLKWSAFREKAEQARQQHENLEGIFQITQALSAADEIPKADARLIQIERSRLLGERQHFEHEAKGEELEIKALMGMQSKAPLELVSSLHPFTGADRPPEELEEALQTRHPMLARVQAEYAAADQKLLLEIRKQVPDLQFGPSYEDDEGTKKVGAALSIPLPIFNRNRANIAEAQAARVAAIVAQEAARERLLGELTRSQHRREAAQVDLKHMVEDLAPLTDEQLSEARQLAETGEVNGLILFQSLNQAYQTKIQMIDAQLEMALEEAELQRLAPLGTMSPMAVKEITP